MPTPARSLRLRPRWRIVGPLALGLALLASSAARGASPGNRAVDGCTVPVGKHPPVVYEKGLERQGGEDRSEQALGWTETLLSPALANSVRRFAAEVRPSNFGHTLAPGERFRFDVRFAGNPAGLAEAEVVAIEPDPRGAPPKGAPTIRLEARASTSGIVSLLATVTDEMVSVVDAASGASVWSENVLIYAGGFSPSGYRRRVTTSSYQGRGRAHIRDVRDDQSREHVKQMPLDTFDPLGLMAWVRAQRPQPGDRLHAHVIDGLTVMRIDVEAERDGGLQPMPSIAKALGIADKDLIKLSGSLTRIDEFDQPIPGKRVFRFRAWLSNDERRIPLAMESDMWVGAIRLELQGYDPPASVPASRSVTTSP